MTGKTTRASVQEYANEKGLEPIQIDGIPEGFSFLEPDITIGNKEHSGGFVAFVPSYPWESAIVKSDDLFDLLQAYLNIMKIRDGK